MCLLFNGKAQVDQIFISNVGTLGILTTVMEEEDDTIHCGGGGSEEQEDRQQDLHSCGPGIKSKKTGARYTQLQPMLTVTFRTLRTLQSYVSPDNTGSVKATSILDFICLQV